MTSSSRLDAGCIWGARTYGNLAAQLAAKERLANGSPVQGYLRTRNENRKSSVCVKKRHSTELFYGERSVKGTVTSGLATDTCWIG